MSDQRGIKEQDLFPQGWASSASHLLGKFIHSELIEYHDLGLLMGTLSCQHDQLIGLFVAISSLTRNWGWGGVLWVWSQKFQASNYNLVLLVTRPPFRNPPSRVTSLEQKVILSSREVDRTQELRVRCSSDPCYLRNSIQNPGSETKYMFLTGSSYSAQSARCS